MDLKPFPHFRVIQTLVEMKSQYQCQIFLEHNRLLSPHVQIAARGRQWMTV